VVGQNKLSAFAADLGLDLDPIVTHWELREIVLREGYRLQLVLRVEYPNMTKQGYKKKNSISSSPKSKPRSKTLYKPSEAHLQPYDSSCSH